MNFYPIYEIKIQLYTNIIEEPIVTFKRSMLIDPEEVKEYSSENILEGIVGTAEKVAKETGKKTYLQDYPYFSQDFKYKNSILSLSFKEKIELFFNAYNFKKYLLTNNDGIFEKMQSTVNAKNDLIKNNISIMLLAFFPTKLQISDTIKNSYDMTTKKESIPSILQILGTSTNSFLNIDFNRQTDRKRQNRNYGGEVEIDKKKTKKLDTVFTVHKVVWLNDFLNHLEYKKIVQKYMVFNEWYELNQQNTKKNQLIDLKKKLYKNVYKNTNSNSDYNQYRSFQKFLSEFIKKRKTCNVELQPLLNPTNDIEVEKFYKFMDGLFEYYISTKENKVESKSKSMNITLKKLQDFLIGKEIRVNEIFIEKIKKLDFQRIYGLLYWTEYDADEFKKQIELFYYSKPKTIDKLEAESKINALLKKTKIRMEDLERLQPKDIITQIVEYPNQTNLEYLVKLLVKEEASFKTQVDSLMNVGFDFIHDSTSLFSSSSSNIQKNKEKRIEIFVMVDLQPGILTSNLDIAKECANQDEDLGRRYLELIEPKINLKYNDDWAVDKNRPMISLNSNHSGETTEDYFHSNHGMEDRYSDSFQNNKVKEEISEPLIDFLDRMDIGSHTIQSFLEEKIKSREIQGIQGLDINDINDKYFESNTLLKMSRMKQPDFYKLLKEFERNRNYYNEAQKKIKKIEFKYLNKTFLLAINQNAEKLKTYQQQNNHTKEEETKLDLIMYVIFIFITETIIQKKMGGASLHKTKRRKKISKHFYTRRRQ
jgi:hypothetical protein